MKNFLMLLALCLTGCAGFNVADMTAAQIRATNGTAACGTSTNIYGKVSIISANTNDAIKGTNENSGIVITCGDANMTISNKVTLPK